jgi:hypothetical protein
MNTWRTARHWIQMCGQDVWSRTASAVNTKLDGPYSWSPCFGEEKISCTCWTSVAQTVAWLLYWLSYLWRWHRLLLQTKGHLGCDQFGHWFVQPAAAIITTVKLHCHYVITVQLCQLAVNFSFWGVGVGWGERVSPVRTESYCAILSRNIYPKL